MGLRDASVLYSLFEMGEAIQETYTRVDSVRTRILRSGKGRPIVLIHGGGPANAADVTWGRLMPRLGEIGEVIAFDQIGFGLTAPSAGADISIEARARHAVALVDMMDINDATLVGHSQGGFIATQIALAEPRRVRALVLVSSGTTAPSGNMQNDGTYSPHVAHIIRFSDEPTFGNYLRIKRGMSARPETVDPDVLLPYYERFMAGDGLAWYVKGTENALRDNPDSYADLHKRFIEPSLTELRRFETCIIWGRDDQFAYTARGMRLADLLPTAEVHLIPKVGHTPMWDAPEAFLGILMDFIRRTTDTPVMQDVATL